MSIAVRQIQVDGEAAGIESGGDAGGGAAGKLEGAGIRGGGSPKPGGIAREAGGGVGGRIGEIGGDELAVGAVFAGPIAQGGGVGAGVGGGRGGGLRGEEARQRERRRKKNQGSKDATVLAGGQVRAWFQGRFLLELILQPAEDRVCNREGGFESYAKFGEPCEPNYRCAFLRLYCSSLLWDIPWDFRGSGRRLRKGWR